MSEKKRKTTPVLREAARQAHDALCWLETLDYSYGRVPGGYDEGSWKLDEARLALRKALRLRAPREVK